MRIRRSLLLGVLTLMVASGCTTTSEGSPEPTPTSETTVETTNSTPPSSGSEEPQDRELPYAGAPKVDTPLDTTRYQQDPCQALTAAQAQELNVNHPGEPRDGALGNACEFPGRSDVRALVELAFLDENPFGLSAVYQANEDGKYEEFNVPPPIEGYPAVMPIATDDRPNGGCEVFVGVSDEIAFALFIRLSTANVGELDPCETAAMVAGMALRTMKEGA
jgi:hypothetical protein